MTPVAKLRELIADDAERQAFGQQQDPPASLPELATPLHVTDARLWLALYDAAGLLPLDKEFTDAADFKDHSQQFVVAMEHIRAARSALETTR